MAMGRQDPERQENLFVGTGELVRAPGHPFYERLRGVLAFHSFDAFVEERCAKFYAETMGRPSIPPPVYFKMLFIGYFEGLDSERGIAWRVADSLALREFLGYDLTERTPDHSSVSRTRRLIDLETHAEVFQWGLPASLWAECTRAKVVDFVDELCPKRDQALSTGLYLAIAAVNRAICAKSKRGMWDWFSQTVLLRHVPTASKTALSSQRFWDHMDRIDGDKALAIWKQVLN